METQNKDKNVCIKYTKKTNKSLKLNTLRTIFLLQYDKKGKTPFVKLAARNLPHRKPERKDRNIFYYI